MHLESVEPQFSLFTLSGLASFTASDRMEEAMLAEASLPGEAEVLPLRSRRARSSPTTFHVAISEGVPIGVATSTVGPFAELPLGLLLVERGADLASDADLPDPVCELVSVSVDAAAATGTDGVTEALYRSFYRQAKRAGAQSVVVGVDPWIYDVLREQYGVPFRVIGPPLEALGRELLAIGGSIAELEEGTRSLAPEFFAYLDQPYGDELLSV